MSDASLKTRWLDACSVNDIPVRGSRRIVEGELTIGLFKTMDGEVYAINNKCPHKSGPLSEGIVHDSSVTCPLHGWIFDLKTGQAQGADEGCVKTFEVDRRDDRVWVKVAG